MTSTRDHVMSAHKRNEETFQAIELGLEYIGTGHEPEEWRESNPELLEDLESLGFDPDSTHPDDDLMEIENDYAVSIDIERVVTIWLTLGGPNIYLEARVRDGEVYDVRHFAAWGSDRRETTVREDSALYRYAERCVELALLD